MPILMKGNVYSERVDAKDRRGNPVVQFPLYAEIKRDEIRCHVRLGSDPAGAIVEFLSYAGKPLCNMHQFSHQFLELAYDSGYSEFDCGFEVNGNYNDSYRWVRSSRGLPDDLRTGYTKFYLYDLPERGEPWMIRVEERLRVAELTDWLYAPTVSVLFTKEEVEDHFARAIDNGHEGLMLKQPSHIYQKGKRTDGWLKMKTELDADGIILGFTEAVCGKDQPEKGLRVGDRLGRAGSVAVQMQDGSIAEPGGIPHELGRDMWEHPAKYAGEWCEFKYMERDRQGGYRHPRFFRLREDKV